MSLLNRKYSKVNIPICKVTQRLAQQHYYQSLQSTHISKILLMKLVTLILFAIRSIFIRKITYSGAWCLHY